jgi:hypothetical protein
MKFAFKIKYMKFKFYVVFTFVFLFSINSNAQNVTVNPGAVSYANLKLAFDAINNGTHKGAVTVSINANTTETATAVLNASNSGNANYTSVNIYSTVTGLTISNAAITISIKAGTYVPANNGAYALTIGERIQFDYSH